MSIVKLTCTTGIIGVAAGKVSVSALILAIMQNTHRVWQKVYLWVFCMVLVCMVCISCSVLTFAQCRPAAALWDTRIKGHCIKPSIMADFGTFTGGRLILHRTAIIKPKEKLTEKQLIIPSLTQVWP
jgi:hypothetical protein